MKINSITSTLKMQFFNDIALKEWIITVPGILTTQLPQDFFLGGGAFFFYVGVRKGKNFPPSVPYKND